MLEDTLNKLGKELVKNTKRSLKAKKKSVSGVLDASIRYNIEETSDGANLEFWMFEYGYYQDEGVKGYKPRSIKVNGKVGKQKAPDSRFKFGTGTGKKGGLFKSIDNWIIRKKLDTRDAKGRFTSRDSIRYAMTKSIYHQGIEPSNFFTEAWEKTLDNIDDKITDDIINDVEKLYFKLL